MHGNWTNWNPATSCEPVSGENEPYQSYIRECLNPAPLHGGLECVKQDGLPGLEELVRTTCCSLEPCQSEGGII